MEPRTLQTVLHKLILAGATVTTIILIFQVIRQPVFPDRGASN
jgi:hypothetical protein